MHMPLHLISALYLFSTTTESWSMLNNLATWGSRSTIRFADSSHQVRAPWNRLLSSRGSDSIRMYASTEAVLADTDDYSVKSLLDRMVKFQAKHKDSLRLAAAVAGGGGNFLSCLAATPGASAILLEGTIAYDRESFQRYINKTVDPESFKFCSSEAAVLASESALENASQMCATSVPDGSTFQLETMAKSVGIGCTSALLSTSKRTGRKSRAFVSVLLPSTLQSHMEVKLADSTIAGRSRFDEDVFISHCILSCLERALSKDYQNGKTKVTTAVGDEVVIENLGKIARDDTECIAEAALAVLSGDKDISCLVPSASGFRSTNHFHLPRKSLVFPGSFNPPHVGHVELAKGAALKSDSDIVWFEISVSNVDKPNLDVDEIVGRVTCFKDLENMPNAWGIILTNAPMFLSKVELLAPKRVGNYFLGRSITSLDELEFVIGTDTLVRLVDPKYYDNSHEAMISALTSSPCRFVVGGRLDQKSESPEFTSGQEIIKALPPQIQAKCTLLEGFRVDVSSSEIRRQLSTKP